MAVLTAVAVSPVISQWTMGGASRMQKLDQKYATKTLNTAVFNQR